MEDTYSSEEAIAQFVNHGLSASRLYRRVSQGEIKKYLPPDRVRGALYSKGDVDRVCKQEGKQTNITSAPIVKEKKEQVQRGSAIIRPLTKDDIGIAYFLQFKQVGMENSIQPTSMQVWIESEQSFFWVACNPEDTHDVWAVIGAIPVDEELLSRFLKGEFTLQEIAISDVLPYSRGKARTCYLVAGVDQHHADALIQLMEYLLSYWCENYPNTSVNVLYVSSPLPTLEETALLLLLKTFFFSRRRDLNTGRGVWELALYEYNPSPSIRRFQKCIEEKQMLAVEEIMRLEKRPSDPPFTSSLKFRRAETKEDVAAMVRIGAEIFVPPGVQPSISNEYQVEVWYSWLQKNPEIFYVLTHENNVIGYISLIPLHMDLINKVMHGAHPTTIRPDDILLFEPNKPCDVYAHMWGTTVKLNDTQKRIAGSTIIRDLRKTFADFAGRGIDIRSIWTRSNTKDGIHISKHLGFKDLEVPGVTDDPDEEHRKHVFHVDTASSTHPIMVQYRQLLEKYKRESLVQNSNIASAS